MSTLDDSTTTSEDKGGGDSDGTVYLYRIPYKNRSSVREPAYEPNINGGLYMWHSAGSYLYILQGKGVGHFHRDDINVQVTELDKEEVENTDNLVGEYT